MKNSKLKSKEEIVDFFQTYIYGFIIRDIENCIKVAANYTVALALLSYTEFLGGLINGKLGTEGTSKINFNKALIYFPKAYKIANNIVIEYTLGKKTLRKVGLYEIFRCGLAHEYFINGMKLTCVWNNPSGFTAKHIGLKKKRGQLIFYNNEYFRDFRKAMDKFYKELIVKNNIRLIRNFSTALNRLERRKLLYR